MVNITQFREDMRTTMTIEEVLEKHDISFKDACEILCRKQKGMKHPTAKKRRYEPVPEKYIYKQGNKYFVRRTHEGKTKSYGGYYTLTDAVKVRDYLVRNGWYKNRLKATCKKLGVRCD